MIPAIPVDAEEEVDPLCGPKSLMVISQKFGISRSLNELMEITGYTEEAGTTLLGLYQASVSLGLPVIPLRLTLDELCENDGPSIAFVDGDHFTVVLESTEKEVRLQDYPLFPYLEDKETFAKRWSGEALLYSSSENDGTFNTQEVLEKRIAGPRIHFAKTIHDFGVCDEGDSLKYVFDFTNVGTDSLKIIYVRSTCKCTSALLSTDTIPPRGKGQISVTYETERKGKGKQKEEIIVRTNDPSNPFITLSIETMILNRERVFPEAIVLENQRPYDTVTKEIVIWDSGKGDLSIEKVTVPEGIEYSIGTERIERGKKTIPIELHIPTGSTPGRHEKEITIKTRNADLSCTVSLHVRSPIVCTPPVILLGGMAPNTTEERTVTITINSVNDIKLSHVEVSSPNISASLNALDDGSKYSLNVVILSDDAVGMIKDGIVLFAEDQDVPVHEIPVMAHIQR
jgi:hypothetical protein